MLPTEPPALIAATLIVCEKVLNEIDGLVSAVRFVDLLNCAPVGDTPAEKQFIPISILATVTFAPDDTGSHVLGLYVIRPGESPAPIMQLAPINLAEVPIKVEGAPRLLNMVLNGVPLSMRLMGLHYIVLMVDDEPVRKTPLMLVRKPQTDVAE